MPKTSATTQNPSGYQKYFDPKSLKSVASSAGIIFLIAHLIDFLSNNTIPLRLLNFIILALCLIITFFFVVNEFGKPEEKVILGVANAALLFFSVIGFNATMASSTFANADRQRTVAQLIPLDPENMWHQTPMPDGHQASFFAFFRTRSWMPSLQLQKQVEKLSLENSLLQQINKNAADSLTQARNSASNNSSRYSDVDIKRYQACKMILDSLKAENTRLAEQIQSTHKKVGNNTPTPSANTVQDTSFMSKGNYINSYRTIKQKFDNDLKQCQQEADEYRSKYNMLLKQAQDLMNRVQPGGK